ncbi:MAG: hypothetical protein GVY10_05520 [Verrucomicrobia bacterium]|jgi:acetaldehyde dehydrogenase (acetylating)|nr:hypothetical protein [Verrucomicrobiota bacterium]
MIHHHLAEANASVFTPWQVSGSEKSEHNLMEMSTFTPKTRAMQHYASVIEAGMTRIPTNSDGNVRTTAFGDRATGELGIVLLNVENAAEEVTLDVSYLDVANFDGVRTTRASAFEDLGTIPVSDGTATLTVPARSIVSLSAEDVGFEDIPVLTVNSGEMLLQVPGYASELSIPVAIEDEAYPWSASLSSRRWAEIVAGESGTGSGAISVAFEDNFSDTHERAVDLTVNGLTLSIVQAPYTDPPVSWWKAVPSDSTTGARDTASLSASHAGIGWVHDDLWPFLYVHSLGGWTWVSSAHGNPDSFYAYSFQDRSWVWMSAATGWAYRFRDPGGWILVAG